MSIEHINHAELCAETTEIVELADEHLEEVAGGAPVNNEPDLSRDVHGETRVGMRLLDPFESKRTITGNLIKFVESPQQTISKAFTRFFPRII